MKLSFANLDLKNKDAKNCETELKYKKEFVINFAKVRADPFPLTCLGF